MTEASRAKLIAAGVNGRFYGQGAATAPRLVPDAAPALAGEKIASIAPINADDEVEPEEVL